MKILKKLKIFFLLPLLISCNNGGKERSITYQEAKENIIQTYTNNRANYIYKSGEYKVISDVYESSGIYPSMKNSKDEPIFVEGHIEKVKRRIDEVVVVDYFQMNEYKESENRVKATTNYYINDDRSMRITLKGFDEIQKIVKMDYVNTITNDLQSAIGEKTCGFEIEYLINPIGLYEQITLRFQEDQSNGNVIDATFTTYFTWFEIN